MFNNWYWFYFHKTFFRFPAKFWHFCRNIPEENVKNTCRSSAAYLLWVPRPYNKPCNWCNKAVNVVNMKFSKLKKNNVRNTNKTWQLKHDSQSKCSNCPHRCTELGSRTKKFCGNKTSTIKSSHCWFYSVLLWFVAEQGEHAAGDAGRRPCKRFCIQRQWNWSDIVVIRAIIGWSWVWVR